MRTLRTGATPRSAQRSRPFTDSADVYDKPRVKVKPLGEELLWWCNKWFARWQERMLTTALSNSSEFTVKPYRQGAALGRYNKWFAHWQERMLYTTLYL